MYLCCVVLMLCWQASQRKVYAFSVPGVITAVNRWCDCLSVGIRRIRHGHVAYKLCYAAFVAALCCLLRYYDAPMLCYAAMQVSTEGDAL